MLAKESSDLLEATNVIETDAGDFVRRIAVLSAGSQSVPETPRSCTAPPPVQPNGITANS